LIAFDPEVRRAETVNLISMVVDEFHGDDCWPVGIQAISNMASRSASQMREVAEDPSGARH